MEIDKIVPLLNEQEQRQLAGVLLDNISRDEVINRGIELHPNTIGSIAIDNTVTPEESGQNKEFEINVGNYLNPEISMELEGQLSVTKDYWDKLGYDVPALSQDRKTKLAAILEANPSHRIFPAPLLSWQDRNMVAEQARSLPGRSKNTATFNALGVPKPDSKDARLLNNPEDIIIENGESYGLRYKSPNGELFVRSDYINALIDSEEALKADDGNVWTFAVIDISARIARTGNERVNVSHKNIDPILTPELIIALQLFHRFNGSRMPERQLELTNEGIYFIDKRGKAKVLESIVALNWYSELCQVNLRFLGAFEYSNNADFGVRSVVNEL